MHSVSALCHIPLRDYSDAVQFSNNQITVLRTLTITPTCTLFHLHTTCAWDDIKILTNSTVIKSLCPMPWKMMPWWLSSPKLPPLPSKLSLLHHPRPWRKLHRGKQDNALMNPEGGIPRDQSRRKNSEGGDPKDESWWRNIEEGIPKEKSRRISVKLTDTVETRHKSGWDKDGSYGVDNG